jgi:hypothetical protein
VVESIETKKMIAIRCLGEFDREGTVQTFSFTKR